MIRDLERWFTEARKAADFFGCVVEIVNGSMAMVSGDGIEFVDFKPPEAM